MNRNNSGCCRAAVVSVIVLLAMGPVMAQTPADIDAARRQAEILQRQEQDRIRRDIEAAQPPEKAPAGIDTRTLVPPVDASVVGAKCRNIRELVIGSAPNLSAAVRRKIELEFTGRCLGVTEIEQILGEITRDYVLRGYITTRAYLPQQDLGTGKLEIIIIEGVIEKIMLDDGGRDSIRLFNAVPAEAGGLLNLRDLEQGIDQINRLASNDARLDIQPGSTPGESVVVIHNQPKRRFRVSTTYDNQGSASTGKHQAGVTLSADNLLTVNDFISIGHRESLPGDQEAKFSESDFASFTLPIGYSTFSYSHSNSRYVSMITMPSGLSLRSTGDSQNDSVSLDRVVYRDQGTRATLTGMLTTKSSQNFLAGELLGVSSRNLTVLDLDAGLTTGFLGGIFSLNLGWAQGLAFAGAIKDPDNLPSSAPRGQFHKLKFGSGYHLPFKLAGQDLAFSSQLTGQQAYDTLYGSEQIMIGGIYTVRGFVRNVLSGDNGYYIRNELSLRRAFEVAGQTLPVRVFFGIDHGEVRNRVANIPSGSLTGAALGASISWAGASWEVFHARPLSQPDSMPHEAAQTWFRLSYNY